MKNMLLHRVALAAFVLLAVACSKTEDAAPVVDTSNDNLLMGNPSGAVSSISSPTNYLLLKTQYATGYNRDQGKPIWVSWHLG
jgi:endonuclease G